MQSRERQESGALFQWLIIEEAAKQFFMAVKHIGLYYKPQMPDSNPAFHNPLSTAYSEWLFMVGPNSDFFISL